MKSIAQSKPLAVELLSRVYDHSKKVYMRGFRLLMLGWSDGNTFMPVNSCLCPPRILKSAFRKLKITTNAPAATDNDRWRRERLRQP